VAVPAFRAGEQELLSWAPLVRDIAKRISRDAVFRLGPRRSLSEASI
jgi:hypothetical protein